jgi:hypothetical protein
MARGKSYGKAIGMPASMDESCSINVTKIDNGYLVRKSKWDGDKYDESTVFSATKPEITMTGTAPAGKKR